MSLTVNRIARQFCGIVVLFAAMAVPSAAQPAGTVTFQMPVQHTGVAGQADETTRIVSGSASLEHWFSNDLGRVFYEISLDRFHTDDAWDTWLHNVGVVRTFERGTTSLDTGAAVFWRSNSGGWADAGFRGFNLQSAVRRELGAGNVSAAYNVYRRTFVDAPALDQTEHHVNVRALANLPSRTTLIGAVSTGWKRYAGYVIETIETTSGSTSARGQGRGVMLLRPVTVYSRSGDAVSRTSWTWTARLAQSIDDRTGVWLEHEQRRTHGEHHQRSCGRRHSSMTMACMTIRMPSTREPGAQEHDMCSSEATSSPRGRAAAAAGLSV